MKQHLHMVTLGVSDLQRSQEFYSQTLGWKIANPQEGIAFFQAGGVIVSLFPREELAHDVQVSAEGAGFAGFTLAYNTQSEAEVDEIIRDLKSKGVKVVKEPQKAPWGGYSSYFADPDGYLWEVAFNPFWSFDAQGNVKLE